MSPIFPYEFFAVVLIIPFSWCFLGGSSFAWVQSVSKITGPISIERPPVFVGEKYFESKSGLLMFKENVGIEYIEPVRSRVVSEFLSCFDKGALKLSSGLVELRGSVHAQSPVAGQLIADNFTNYPSDNSVDGKTDKKLNHWHYLGIGFGTGAWFTVFFKWIMTLILCSPNGGNKARGQPGLGRTPE